MSYSDPVSFPNTARPRCKATYPVAVGSQRKESRCRSKAVAGGFCRECAKRLAKIARKP